LEELIKAISSHTYPQYFNHLCLVSELFYLDVSRFQTLLSVAIELEKEVSGYFYSKHISKADSITVGKLVKLHQSAMAQNQVTTVLFDDRVSSEVEDFIEASEAVGSHICPLFYMLVVSYFEMLMVHSSRFPTLIGVAQELKKVEEDTDGGSSSGSKFPFAACYSLGCCRYSG
jgi:hypothetical protein